MEKIKVAVNGYGIIGKRVADAVILQPDMELIGISGVASGWRMKIANIKKIPVFAFGYEAIWKMKKAGIEISGVFNDLLNQVDIVVDCTPKRFGAHNATRYQKAGVKYILQGGENHESTGHSFVSESNYYTAVGRHATRVVSCNTISIVRTLSALKKVGLLNSARGTLFRQPSSSWEGPLGGNKMKRLLLEKEALNQHGADAMFVDPELDVVTAVVNVPETLSHLHFWVVRLTRSVSKKEVLDAFRKSTRIAFIRYEDGLSANNAVKEMMLDLGRPHSDMYEVAIWEDMLRVEGDELHFAYLLDHQTIGIPENIDAIRALSGIEKSGQKSISTTNKILYIQSNSFLQT